MKNKLIRALSGVMCFTILSTFMIGCQKKNDLGSNEPISTVSPGQIKKDQELPIVKDPITVKGWALLQANQLAAGLKSYSDIKAFTELEKRTNIKVDWTNPSSQNASEVFKLMVASGDLPDFYIWETKSTEIAKLYSDGALEKLNNLVNDFGPNITKTINDVPNLKKNVLNDQSELLYIPTYITGDSQNIYNRIHIRRDWLKKVGMDMPKTQDEWYKVLKAFKETDLNNNGKKDEIPLSINSNSINGFIAQILFWPLGMTADFYQVDGKIKYGPYEADFAKGLELGYKLYSEGLIDPDFVTQNLQKVEQKVSSNLVGASISRMHVRCTQIKDQLKDSVPDYDMWVAPYMTAKDGKRYTFTQSVTVDPRGAYGLFLSPNSKYKKELIKWMDYQFTEEGGYLMNYGVEGVSRKTVNGVPQLDTELLKDEKGNIVMAKSCNYTAFGAGWPSFMPNEEKDGKWPVTVFLNAGNNDLIKDSVDILKNGDLSRAISGGMSFTDQEQQILTEKMSTIKTFVDEKCLKIISGAEPVSKYPQYIEEMKKMGIEDVIKVYQQALDRYNKRK